MANPGELCPAGKPCVLSSARFPLESVFLGGSSSPFAAAILDAQKSCRASLDEMSCTANTTALNTDVLETALNFTASTTNSTQRFTNNPGSSDGASIIKKADAGPDFPASWGLPVAGAFKESPASPPSTPDAASSAAPPVADQATNAAQVAAKPPLPALQPLVGSSLSLDSTALMPASTSVSASASVSRSSAGDLLQNPGAWMKPIQTSEAWSGLFGAAEFPTLPGGPTQLGTWKAATVSLRVLHIMPVFPRGKFCSKGASLLGDCPQNPVVDGWQARPAAVADDI